jgi:hypothetical protein
MFYTDIKKKLNKMLKRFLLDIADKCKQGRLSQKSIGVIIRTFHMSAPINFIIILLFASHLMCVLTMIFLVFVACMFYTFDGCFLSILEKELCNDDFTIIDPNLEILNMEVNNKNRLYISNIIGIVYILSICLLYYIRFHTNVFKMLSPSSN